MERCVRANGAAPLHMAAATHDAQHLVTVPSAVLLNMRDVTSGKAEGLISVGRWVQRRLAGPSRSRANQAGRNACDNCPLHAPCALPASQQREHTTNAACALAPLAVPPRRPPPTTSTSARRIMHARAHTHTHTCMNTATRLARAQPASAAGYRDRRKSTSKRRPSTARLARFLSFDPAHHPDGSMYPGCVRVPRQLGPGRAAAPHIRIHR